MTPDEVGRMDNKECIVMIRGEYPIKGKKLDATKHKRAKQSGLFGKPYFHRKSQSIQWKDVSEIRKNEIVLTYEMIMELLETGNGCNRQSCGSRNPREDRKVLYLECNG